MAQADQLEAISTAYKAMSAYRPDSIERMGDGAGHEAIRPAMFIKYLQDATSSDVHTF